LGLRTNNAKLSHAVIKRRAIHTEARSGSGWAANHPVRLGQDIKDVVALDGFEGAPPMA
jgi:hypothetical protein